ncbi:hypothetical protein ACQ4LE_001057 [Meloidogyne hapla]
MNYAVVLKSTGRSLDGLCFPKFVQQVDPGVHKFAALQLWKRIKMKILHVKQQIMELNFLLRETMKKIIVLLCWIR